MDKVKVKKASLVEILKTNRKEHRDLFLKAQAKYRELIIAALDEQLKEARDGKMPKWSKLSMLMQPQDHTEDYDRVLHMLELSEDNVIELSARAFQNYVEDDWEWSRQWALSNSGYVTSPKMAKYLTDDEQ